MLLLVLLILLLPAPGPVTWLTPTDHDFGNIPQGKPVEYVFRFQNSSDRPLVIDNVRTSCGCTTSDWPKEAIAPDSTAIIRVEFSARAKGPFFKPVKVYFHGYRNAEKLTVAGLVE